MKLEIRRGLRITQLKPFSERKEKKDLDSAGSKGILAYIDADEYFIGNVHTSMRYFSAMAGFASEPILHDDEGSLTQPTYHGFGRKITDSFEGSLTQNVWGYPALPNLGYVGDTYSYINHNINFHSRRRK
jgi:hypothetical protein